MEEGYKKLDLLVVCDIKWSETAMIAHYVLPECSPQERSDLPAILASAGRPAVTMRYQAVDIIHPHTKPLDIIITELSAAMGLEKYFNFTREELVSAMLKPLGITDEELRQKGTISFPSTFEKVPKFDTPSKKVELYCKAFADNGYDPVPKWIPPLSKAEQTGDNFVLVTGKQGFMSHTTTAGDPYLLEIAKRYSLERVWINADRARRLGIKDGDLVEISSPKATRKLKAKVTERIHPEAAFIPLGYGRYSPWMAVGKDFGVSPNDFAPFRVEDIAGHAVMQDVLLKIRKAGV
jgi:thiosulfate reductase/polysulfide reductase chain A